MPIYLPEEPIAYKDREDLTLWVQRASDDGFSYHEVYKKCDCDCGAQRCMKDKFLVIFHNDEIHEEQEWDAHDMIAMQSVLAQAIEIAFELGHIEQK